MATVHIPPLNSPPIEVTETNTLSAQIIRVVESITPVTAAATTHVELRTLDPPMATMFNELSTLFPNLQVLKVVQGIDMNPDDSDEPHIRIIPHLKRALHAGQLKHMKKFTWQWTLDSHADWMIEGRGRLTSISDLEKERIAIESLRSVSSSSTSESSTALEEVSFMIYKPSDTEGAMTCPSKVNGICPVTSSLLANEDREGIAFVRAIRWTPLNGLNVLECS